MARRISPLLILSLLVACTGQNQKQSVGGKTTGLKPMPFASAIKYVQGEIIDAETAAQSDGEPVSWSQLNSNEPALAELEERWLSKAVAFTNLVVQELTANDNLPATGLTIEYYFPAPQDPDKLDKLGLINSDTLKSVFVGYRERGVLAKVGETKVLAKDLLAQSLANMKLYQDLYTQRMRRLNGVVLRRYLLKAAKEKNQGMEQYIKENILSEEMTVTADEVQAFAREKGIAETDINEELIEKLQAIVGQQKRDRLIEDYVATKLVKSPVAVVFSAPEYIIKTPDLTDKVPFWGSSSGKDLLFIGHLTCDSCKQAVELFLRGKEQFAQSVRGSFVYFFQDTDRESRMGAEAALCVHEQDPNYFWKFIEASMQADQPNSEEAINESAKFSGADFAAFRQCFLARKFQQSVDTHLSMVKQMGIYEPPLMVVEGRVFEAPFNEAELQKALESVAGGRGFTDENGHRLGFFGRIKAFFANLFS